MKPQFIVSLNNWRVFEVNSSDLSRAWGNGGHLDAILSNPSSVSEKRLKSKSVLGNRRQSLLFDKENNCSISIPLLAGGRTIDQQDFSLVLLQMWPWYLADTEIISLSLIDFLSSSNRASRLNVKNDLGKHRSKCKNISEMMYFSFKGVKLKHKESGFIFYTRPRPTQRQRQSNKPTVEMQIPWFVLDESTTDPLSATRGWVGFFKDLFHGSAWRAPCKNCRMTLLALLHSLLGQYSRVLQCLWPCQLGNWVNAQKTNLQEHVGDIASCRQWRNWPGLTRMSSYWNILQYLTVDSSRPCEKMSLSL